MSGIGIFATLESDQQTAQWAFAANSLRQQELEGPTKWEGAIGAFGDSFHMTMLLCKESRFRDEG